MRSATGKKLLTNFLSLGAVQATASVIQLIVVPHVVSTVGIAGFGVIAVAQVTLFLLAAFTDYGFAQTATRDISLNRDDHSAVSRIFCRVLFSKMLLCGIAFVVLVVLVQTVPILEEHGSLYYWGFLFVLGQTFFVGWFFQGIEKMKIVALLTLLARVVFAVLTFAFVRQKGDEILFLFFMGVGNLVAAATGIFLAGQVYPLRFAGSSIKEAIAEIRNGWPLFLANLSSYACQYGNIFILRGFANDVVVGYYAVAERIFFTVRQVLVVYSQATYPQLCLVVNRGRDAMTAFLRRFYLPFLGCVMVGSLLLFILAPQVLYYFAGAAYYQSVFALRVFCLVVVIICLNIPATLGLLGLDQRQKYFAVILSGLMINIGLNFFLAGLFGARGTVIAILLTESFITIMLGIKIIRVLRIRPYLETA